MGPGINDIYRYIDSMVDVHRRAMLEKRPAPKLTQMFIELKTKIHTMESKRGEQ